MNLKLINLVLANLEAIRRQGTSNKYAQLPDELKMIILDDDIVKHEVNSWEPQQGIQGYHYEIYKIPNSKDLFSQKENLYLQIEVITDSYGEYEEIGRVQFVTKEEKSITLYDKE